ncbi:MAG: hypothetical protein HFE86_07850 [Clostridiales bacterium]|nr:hypothetical protein [Clostridiales bacterium]
MHTYTLSVKALRLWRDWLALLYMLLMFLWGALLALFPPAAWISGGVFLPAGLLLWFWYLPRLRKSYRVTLSQKAVTLSRGVFVRRQYLLPCPRLIYVEQFSTPLSALRGLRGLRLRAARGQLTVLALDKADAEDFLSKLDEINSGEK